LHSFIDRRHDKTRHTNARVSLAQRIVRTWLCLAPITLLAAPAHFYFGPNGNEAVLPAYDTARGFGFEPDAPNKFSARLPEGNYRVTVNMGSRRAAIVTSVRAEQRRLMLQDVATARGTFDECSFNVNVRTPDLGELPANAPGGVSVKLKPREIGAPNWDDKLTLEFLPTVAVESILIDPVDVPTLYLAGDSTVTDQPAAPNGSWGQVLPRFFDATVAVANHAESGETLKSFLTELRFDKLLSKLRAGDWVMIQFAHNDQKTQWPQTYAEAATTYRAYLRVYIAEIRRRGATPILVTPPERRNFDPSGHIVSTLGDYPEAMRAVAREERAALIDLSAASRAFYEALGPEVSRRAFADDGKDKTHFSDYGAANLARIVADGVRGADPELVAGLAAHLANDMGSYDPAHPAPPSLCHGKRSR
jgi:lysophospholipase L1-like esterase